MSYVNVLNYKMEIRNGLVVIHTFLKEQILSIHSIGHKKLHELQNKNYKTTSKMFLQKVLDVTV